MAGNAWDRGALSYYNSEQVAALAKDPSESVGRLSLKSQSSTAFVLSMDPGFFRIYGPMVLFNAQQIPETDVVIVFCADADTAAKVQEDAEAYVTALARLNKQPKPTNVHIHTTPVPGWVDDPTTFYACARFLALPQILSTYDSIYSLDADLIMRSDPAAFLKSVSKVKFSVPKNEGMISAVPWRRFMAGNLAANSELLGDGALDDLLAYISVGLQQKQAWTLDQNALSYAIERMSPGAFARLNDFSRPTLVSNYMGRWERNYSKNA